MYKILVYVDAENVTFSTFKPYWDEAIALNGFYEIIGKFYGSKDLLGGTVKQYLSLGLEYCETSALSSECHKNLADMKLITDCLHDVLHTYNTEVAQVYLLSKDYDFLPTVYKLKSLGMDTVTLGVDCRGDTKSVKTIIAYLHNVGFLPCADKTVNQQAGDIYNYERPSQLTQWPVQIKLAPVNAPYFDGAKLLIAADCTAYAYASFHEKFIKGHVTLIGCPKLDSVDYSEKLTEIIRRNDIQSVTIVRMEVPCCGGLEMAAKKALQDSGKFIPWQVATISIDGRILD